MEEDLFDFEPSQGNSLKASETDAFPLNYEPEDTPFQENPHIFHEEITTMPTLPRKMKKIAENPRKSQLSKKSSRNFPQKNAPLLFGKKLNTMVRMNRHFSLRKREIFKENEEKVRKFHKWLDENTFERLVSLESFKNVWTIAEKCEDFEFRAAFKQLSLEFFSKFATRYIVNSSMRPENKRIYLKLIPVFLKGVENPESFNVLKVF